MRQTNHAEELFRSKEKEPDIKKKFKAADPFAKT
jgi:hypothetical protein